MKLKVTIWTAVLETYVVEADNADAAIAEVLKDEMRPIETKRDGWLDGGGGNPQDAVDSVEEI